MYKRLLKICIVLLVSHSACGANIVGVLEGEATNDMGMLNYRLALELPKGPKGIQPVLGIKYNAGSNYGFNLYGTSTISRCSADKKIDGFSGGVHFDANDRYCLDGARLIVTLGRDGSANAQYSTEQKNYSRIQSSGGGFYNPGSWKIETKDGYILHYGTDSASKDSTTKGHYRWHLSSKEDRFGNKINYNYKDKSGKTILDSIVYSIHTIKFNYTSLSYPVEKYEYGKAYLDNYSLSSIDIESNYELKRTYNFNYETVGVGSVVRLKEVSLCDGYNCTRPTVFNWYDPENINPMLRGEATIFTGTNKFLGYQLIDVTADGQDDVCYPDYHGYIVCDNKSSVIGTSFSNLKEVLSTLQFNDIHNDGYKDYCISSSNTGTYCGINKGNGSFFSVSKWSDKTSSGNSSFRYIDINNDKYTDLCVVSGDSLSCSINNKGNGFGSDMRFTMSFDDPKQSFFTDINGDGAVDVCGLSGGFSCYLNTSSGNTILFSIKQVWSAGAELASQNDVLKDSLRMTDFNGDGLPDACYVYNGTLRCAINNGDTFIRTQSVASVDGNWGPKIEDSAKNLRLLDINQDGKVDACIHYDSGSYYCAFNKGNNTLGNMRQYAQFDPMLDDYNLSGYGTISGSANPITFSDVNGDAKLDVCYHSRSGISCAVSDASAGEHLLKEVVSPYNTTEFGYSTLTKGDVYTKSTTKIGGMINIQPSLNVLASLTTDNASGGKNTLDYQYEGLRYDLDDGMRAFEKIIKTNHATHQKTISTFHQKGKLNGRVKNTTVFVDAAKISENDDEYSLIQDNNTYDIRTIKTTTKSYDLEGNLLKTKITTHSDYDRFANPQKVVERVEAGSDIYELTTNSTYLNDEINWLISKPITINTIHNNANGSIRKNMAFYYNPDGSLKMDIKEPGHPLSLTSHFEYDRFGNKTKTTITDSSGNQRTSSTEYHNNGINVVKNINALGHSETYAYDDFCAKPLSATGPNGLTTTWQYDALCRVTLETRADNTTTQTQYDFSDNYPLAIGDTNTAKYKVTRVASGSGAATIYYDGLGNEVRSKKVGFNGDTILQDTLYNARGLIQKTTLPYYEGLFAGDNTAWTHYEYDELGRKTQQVRPSDQGDITTRFAYKGHAVITTDSLGNDRTVVKNVQDKVSKVIDADGSTVINTYDPAGNQLSSSVNSRNGARMTYDIMGNKLTMNDVSMGNWSYVYNAFGELTSQTDAKGQTTQTGYDALGRVIAKTTPEGQSVFVYDSASNGIGKIHQEISPVKTAVYTYDGLGRLKTTTNDIKGEQFIHAVEYDNYSRPNKLLYPKNTIINRNYNEYGYLKSITMPKAQVWTPELLELQNTLDSYMKRVNELNELAVKYEAEAKQKISLADRARQSADALMRQANYEASRANTLKRYAKSYESYAGYWSRRAATLRSQARQYYNWMGNSSMRLIAKYSNGWVRYHGSKKRGKRTDNYYWNLKGFFRHNAWPEYLHVGRLLNQYAAQYQRFANNYTNYKNNNNNQAASLELSANIKRQQAQALYQTAEKHYADARKLTDTLRGIVKDKKDYEDAASVVEENLNAYMEEVADEEIIIWAATSLDAAGRLSGEITGNGVLTRKRYDTLTGQLNSIQSEHGYTQLRDLHYEYNTQNSVTRMVDNVAQAERTYRYDVRHQLIGMSETLGGVTSDQTYEYDSFGNMTAKSDVGTMTYNGNNQLTRLSRHNGTTASYTYDANGNLTSGGGRTIQWTSFNKAKLITQASASTELQYDAHNTRAIQTIRNNNVKIEDGYDTVWRRVIGWKGRFQYEKQLVKRYIYVDNIETTTYSANGYEMVEEIKNNKTYKKFRIHLYAGDEHIGIYVKSLEGTDQEKAVDRLRYFHKDALGNIDLITDINGKVVARQHYAAFGKREQSLSDEVIIDEVKRGFTGHEHLDELGLINMNARLYDPEIGRFLSADTFIQDPHLTLSHNRYLYVMNNPLKYTDPSGHFWNFVLGAVISYAAAQSDNPVIRTVGMIVGGAMMGGAFGGETLFANAVHTNMSAGFVMGGINSGTAEGAILGMVSAGLTYGIGHTESLPWHDNLLGTAIAHGTAQGLIAEASGGEFKHGFGAGFVGHLSSAIGEHAIGEVGTHTDPGSVIGRTTIAATLGGLTAKATGGDFTNGAISAAFVHLFNHEAHYDGKRLRMYDDDGNLVGDWSATSGDGSTVDQTAVGKGPIPEGRYVARQDRLQFRSDQSFWGKIKSFFGGGTWPGGSRSWGESRVWLGPEPGTETHGRSGFSIHGGDDPGSAGCIDLCGAMPGFTQEFQRAGHDVNVIVEY